MKRVAFLSVALIVGLLIVAFPGGWPAPTAAGAPSTTIAKLAAPPAVPASVRRGPAKVVVALETTEVRGVLADGVEYVFWTFNGTVPGPMIRVRVGDDVELRLKNGKTSKQIHSIDLHAVTGPGGGATLTQAAPGKETAFRFKALNPGLNLDRTYLGLPLDCASCHPDAHRAQLSGACDRCHGIESWRPALLFSHDRSRYPLKGKHVRVPCGKCHPAVDTGDGRGGSRPGPGQSVPDSAARRPR